MKVFIGGSRDLSRLNKDVAQRIDNIISQGFTVVVGDANGADKAVQHYLESKNYSNTVVFCMKGHCRNNLGRWPTRNIEPPHPTRRDFAYYSTKDRAMANEADYGLMLWDGRSRGTLSNMIDLVRQSKPVLVYVAPAKRFYTLRQSEHIADLLHRFDPSALQRVDRELHAFAADSLSHRKAESGLSF